MLEDHSLGRGRPRVLHVLESWPPVTSGYATRSQALLAGQERAGAAIPYGVVTSRQHVYGETDVRVPEALSGRLSLVAPSGREQVGRRLRSFYVDGAHLQTAIRDAGRRCGADLVHVHWSSSVGQAARRAARSLGVPLVAEVRFDLAGAVMTETLQFSCSPLESLLRRWFERHLRFAHGIVAASHSLGMLVRRHLPEKMPPVTVVPNGTELPAFAPAPASTALRRKLNLDGALVVGSTTKMLRYEGLDLLLHALARLRANGSEDVRVLLVGDGPERPALQAKAERQQLPVTFRARVPREQVAAHLRLMDLFAVPRRSASITRYASPVKVIEAMACGLPVIGSRLGDLPWMLAEDRGVLIEPESAAHLADAIASLAAAPDRRRAIGQRARRWTESQPTWADAARRYDDVYRHALQAFQTHDD